MLVLPSNQYHSEDQESELQKGALAAMQRAAEEARNIAIQTNTAIVVKVDGEIRHITAAELISQRETAPNLGYDSREFD
jgi:hypothetical protein